MTEKFIYGNEDERIYDRAFRSASFYTPNYVEICFPVFFLSSTQNSHTFLFKKRKGGFEFLAPMGGSIPVEPYPNPAGQI